MPRPGERTPIDVRIARHIIKSDDGCWIWQGSRDKYGYGRMMITHGIGHGQRAQRSVHRVSYEFFVGPLIDGLVIDHLCRRPLCVNPEHLEQVTSRENVERGLASPTKPACINGHLYDEANTYVYKGGRHCRTCGRARTRRYKARRAAARLNAEGAAA